ncbi:DUF998 domain-containing protein [Archangium lansingense]|uniref:DUF998 domain-containing protein n=1 Tax=Archangium lansingense TaxID=2995310 RepID=A0ABT4A2E8_9BACT|nr:DUF998 domain-containing protein [Archangium lansinium]MCY1075827.1 DUF998 domain-containing protein [Archangium lansinium]
MSRLRSTRLIVSVAALATIAAPFVFGAMFPGYSHVRDYISELGAAGAPDASAVNLFTFLPTGLLFIAAAFSLKGVLPRHRAVTAGLALISLAGGSYIGAAFVPCDAGCPATGSGQQVLHNLIGLAGYLGAGLGLGLVGAGGSSRTVGRFAIAAGVVVIAGLVVMGAPEAEPWRGLAQRIVECAIVGWMVLAAFSSEAADARTP